MQHILNELKITDDSSLLKLEELICQNTFNTDIDKYYRLNIIYRYNDITLLIDSNKNKRDIKDQIYKILSESLDKIVKLFEIHNIKICSSSIIGRKLDESQIIIEVYEEEPVWDKKKKSFIKVSSIMPDESYIQDTMSKIANKNLSELYFNLVNSLGNNRLCEVLNIPKTDKDKVIYSAFFDQYKQLGFLPNKEEVNELKEKVLKLLKAEEEEKQG